jgi:hypothetical protein
VGVAAAPTSAVGTITIDVLAARFEHLQAAALKTMQLCAGMSINVLGNQFSTV